MAYVKSLDSDELGPRFDRCPFIGCPKKTKGYFFCLEDEQRVFITLRATFLENEFLGEGIVASKIDLDEVQPMEKLGRSKDIIELVVIESHPKLTPRRSDSVPHQLNRLWFHGPGW